jgi:hypothetical protein
MTQYHQNGTRSFPNTSTRTNIPSQNFLSAIIFSFVLAAKFPLCGGIYKAMFVQKAFMVL